MCIFPYAIIGSWESNVSALSWIKESTQFRVCRHGVCYYVSQSMLIFFWALKCANNCTQILIWNKYSSFKFNEMIFLLSPWDMMCYFCKKNSTEVKNYVVISQDNTVLFALEIERNMFFIKVLNHQFQDGRSKGSYHISMWVKACE